MQNTHNFLTPILQGFATLKFLIKSKMLRFKTKIKFFQNFFKILQIYTSLAEFLRKFVKISLNFTEFDEQNEQKRAKRRKRKRAKNQKAEFLKKFLNIYIKFKETYLKRQEFKVLFRDKSQKIQIFRQIHKKFKKI